MGIFWVDYRPWEIVALVIAALSPWLGLIMAQRHPAKKKEAV